MNPSPSVIENDLAYPDNGSVIAAVEKSGHPHETIGYGPGGMPIVCVKLGGPREPSILVTAGAHAGEPSGVTAALKLLQELHTENQVYLVPLRDPFAWGGFSACISLALGQSVNPTTHAEVKALLEGKGQLLYEEEAGNFQVSKIGQFGFVSMLPLSEPRGPRDIERRLRYHLRTDPDLVKNLQGLRLVFPTNLEGVEGCGFFERAFSAWVNAEGEVCELNRSFDRAAPAEVACIRDLVDRIRPGLILDLHEGQGSGFYVFVSTPEQKTFQVARAVINAAVQAGAERYTIEELAQRVDGETLARLNMPEPGIILGPTHSSLQGASFGTYAERHGIAMTTETGRWTSLAARTRWQVAGAIAGVEKFVNLDPT